MNSEAVCIFFKDLYEASTESKVNDIINKDTFLFGKTISWYPLDGNESNFGVIENQQSSPIAALIEKITNAIDAILMRKCFEPKFMLFYSFKRKIRVFFIVVYNDINMLHKQMLSVVSKYIFFA